MHGEVELRVPLAHRRERLHGPVDEVRRALASQLEALAPGLHAPPVEQALDDQRQALGLARETAEAFVLRRQIAPRALHRLDEEANAGEGRAKLVADLGDEVRLELAQVRLAPEKDEDQDDARDRDEDEADREDPEEEVERAPHGHEHDPDQQDERRRHDDQVHEQLDDPPVAEALPVLGHPINHTTRRPLYNVAESAARIASSGAFTPSQSSRASAPWRASMPRPSSHRSPRRLAAPSQGVFRGA